MSSGEKSDFPRNHFGYFWQTYEKKSPNLLALICSWSLLYISKTEERDKTKNQFFLIQSCLPAAMCWKGCVRFTREAVCQFVYGGCDVPLLHSTPSQLLHGSDELRQTRQQRFTSVHTHVLSGRLSLSPYLFAIVLKTPVGLDHLTLRKQKEQTCVWKSWKISAYSPSTASAHLQLLCFPSHFEQLRDGVHEPLEVMVTHLLNLSVMVPDPSIQLIHEEAMLLAIINRPGRGDKENV